MSEDTTIVERARRLGQEEAKHESEGGAMLFFASTYFLLMLLGGVLVALDPPYGGWWGRVGGILVAILSSYLIWRMLSHRKHEAQRLEAEAQKLG